MIKIKNVSDKPFLDLYGISVDPDATVSLTTTEYAKYSKYVDSGIFELVELAPESTIVDAINQEKDLETLPEEEEAREREVEKIFIRKIHQKNFWAVLFSAIPKIPVYHIPTLRLRWDLKYNYGVCLEYNPKFLVKQYEKNDRLLDFCLAHEGGHLILHHMTRWVKFKNNLDLNNTLASQTRFNIAVDLAVNPLAVRSILDSPDLSSYTVKMKAKEFRKKYLTADYFPEDFRLDDELSWEQYYKQLKNTDAIIEKEDITEIEVKKEPSSSYYHAPLKTTVYVPKAPTCPITKTKAVHTNIQNDEHINTKEIPSPLVHTTTTLTGDHSWTPPEGKEFPNDVHVDILEGLTERLSSYINLRVQSYEKTVGQLPGSIRETILNACRPRPPISWKSLLINMCMSGKPADDDISFSRWNRRLIHLRDQGILPLPGSQMNFKWSIALIIDTSGSMSSNDVAECTDVIRSLLHFDSSLVLNVVYADTQIRESYVVHSEKDIPTSIVGRGGTDFRAPIHDVEKEINPDLIIYCTDGYGCAPARKPSTPIIWCVPETYHTPAPYGLVVRIRSGKIEL